MGEPCVSFIAWKQEPPDAPANPESWAWHCNCGREGNGTPTFDATLSGAARAHQSDEKKAP